MSFCKARGLMSVVLGLAVAQSTLLLRPLPCAADNRSEAAQLKELSGATQWLNSAPLSLKDLRGKVVAIDFYTSGCSNCLAAVPHVVQLFNKYHKQGLVVIGVHTPETNYERQLSTVQETARHLGILYPIAVDNRNAIWSTYQNQYWPNILIFNKEGKLVYEHAGEGNYGEIDSIVGGLL